MAGIFEWFLGMGYFWIIFIVSLVATLVTTLIYKYVTDQRALKKAREDIKSLRQKQKSFKDNPKKLMEVQNEMLEKNMVMMKQSFKPMIYTFLPLIILFYWLSSTVAFYPLESGQDFNVTAIISLNYPGNIDNISLTSTPQLDIIKQRYESPDPKVKMAQWKLKAPSDGTYTLLFEGDTFRQTKEITITSQKRYAQVMTEYKDSQLQKVILGNREVKPFGSFSLFGWKPGWLGTYIILSIAMSMLIRKILDVA